MHLPRPHVDLSELLTSTLSKAGDALARTVAAARDWLPVSDEDQVHPQRETLTEAEFARVGTDLLGEWGVLTVAGPVAELRNILQSAGFQPGRTSCGTRAAGPKCLGRYISIDVTDPMLGNFVARLWLLADWDRGLALHLGAYRPVRPAGAMRNPADVEPGALAMVELAMTRCHWAELTLTEAEATLWQWQEAMLTLGADGSVGTHWPTLLSALDAAMAP